MDLHTLIWFIIAGGVGIWFITRSKGSLSLDAAADKVSKGAVVLDVRTKGEFQSGHIDSAINLPLDQIDTQAMVQLSDPDQEILCYCQSGMRSSMAAKSLKSMGYKAHNLGSYGRARMLEKKVSG
jgi:phage shock protein E